MTEIFLPNQETSLVFCGKTGTTKRSRKKKNKMEFVRSDVGKRDGRG